jgi:hypothetical protein
VRRKEATIFPQKAKGQKMSDKSDNRTVPQLFKEWRKFQEVKRQLVKSGKISGDAKTDDVIEALRNEIPPDTFTK